MYTEHVSKFCHVCATISSKVMVISTLFADLGTADNGRNEPNLSPGLFRSDLCNCHGVSGVQGKIVGRVRLKGINT